VFDRAGVTFVSVTQSFNTTTSMGRLTLNILLSFAQFEREVIAERVRDKIRASRQKGMWMGGNVPFGYRVENRKLLVHEPDATMVRTIFERFVRIGSATVLAGELREEGVRAPSGKAFDKGALYHLLNNRTYLGLAVHKGTAYPGEHAAIIDQGLWDKVHAILAENARGRSANTRAQTPALLKGLIFGPTGAAMSPTHTRKGNRLYRYYVSQDVVKRGPDACPVGRVSAAEIEAAVVDQLRGVFRQPDIMVGTWHAGWSEQEDITEEEIREALLQLDPLWDELFPAEQARMVQLLVERVEVRMHEVEVRFRPNGLSGVVRDAAGNRMAAA
jgi:site-specific DNA recombinase